MVSWSRGEARPSALLARALERHLEEIREWRDENGAVAVQVQTEGREAVLAARAYLGRVARLLDTGCLGQLPEVLDGDAPHQARGCDAQAWSVTEALRVFKTLQGAAATPSAERDPI